MDDARPEHRRAGLEQARFAACCLSGGEIPENVGDVDFGVLSTLAAQLSLRSLRPGEKLWQAHRRPSAVWIIQHGLVEVAVGRGARRRVVQTAGAGEVVGIVQLLGGLDVPCQAQAVDTVSVLEWPASLFFGTLHRRPALALMLLPTLSRRVTDGWVRLASVAVSSLEVRAARILLIEARDGVVALPQDVVASMIGASRQALNRILRGLQTTGVIELSYRAIRILDRAALVRLAQPLQDEPVSVLDSRRRAEPR